jgi:hypothetical protein
MPACRRRPSVLYPNLRSWRIAETIKGVTKILSCICAPCTSIALAKCLKLLIFRLYFILLMKKLWAWLYILCPRLRFELRSVDRLGLAHTGLDEWLLIPWVGEIPPKLTN